MANSRKGRLRPSDFPFSEREITDYLEQHSNESLVEYAKNNPLRPNLFSSDGQGMFMTSTITAIKSQAGQGKTKSCCLLAGSMLGGGHDFGLDYAPGKVIVRMFDTEMPEQLTADIYKSVNHMAPMPCHDASLFFVTNLVNTTYVGMENKVVREFWCPQKKESFILNTIIQDCAMIFGTDHRLVYFIDGVAQLVDDPNDMEECKEFSERWIRFVSDKPICVCFIIHENQGKQNENGKMTGHLGSYIMKQAREVYRTARPNHGDIFTITNNSDDCKYTYGARLPDVNFSIDSNGFFIPADSPASAANERKAATRRGTLEENFKSAFEFCNASVLSYTSLKMAYTTISKSSERTATRAIKEAWALGILAQNKDGSYALKVS